MLARDSYFVLKSQKQHTYFFPNIKEPATCSFEAPPIPRSISYIQTFNVLTFSMSLQDP